MPHIHKDIDYTVSIYIVCKNKVLLRMHEKFHKWLVPGGHIELDETPQEAAVREVKEETGLDVMIHIDQTSPHTPMDDEVELYHPAFLNIHEIPGLGYRHRHLDFVYFATSTSEVIAPTHEDDRSDDCLWLTADEVKVKKDLSERVRYYALSALKVLSK